ncbi:MAG TPA: serine hydrolase domain-containing protein [Flavobacteriaceae bacterium]|nr:beta-lactamase family protein [Flavobacteriaceae bacterium]MCB9212063.1 beta-lactamase family protein [Alteromonas sp.]HPF09842.1 serine hydrolase domain-containing protein [Flavobacteriaceae bacterium]HQU22045.1 serine hydrolase domain-containing protein [Flavobacteriaceae bacterium]HQU64074.1 serine hydrolase domain-containing protein [Flavobacteriaceae bacterium]
MTKCNGHINQEFKGIERVFLENFFRYGEIGASFCVYHKHQLVVDIWGGYKNLKSRELWQRDTVVPIFSTTKAVASLCLAMLHSKGLFEYEDPVCNYWKEFSANGKAYITIAQLFGHRAGLSAINTKLTKEIIDNPVLLDELLANQKPYWPVNEYQGYHVWTIGWYLSALISRIDTKHRRLRDFFEEEVLPKIDGEIRIGINDDYDLKKIAILKPFSKRKGLFSMPFKFVKEFFNPWSITYRSMLNPSFLSNHTNMNQRELLQLEIGGAGGIANAKGLASFMDCLTNPKSELYLGKPTLEILYRFPEPPIKGFEDYIFKQDAFIFSCGLVKPSKHHAFAPNKKSFGGFGAGGSFVSVDPENELIIAYTMNKMSPQIMNMDREVRLRKAVYKIINSDV